MFDGEILARALAACPLPVVCGLGHEDDTTIADLVADYRAATPTGAIVALLPDRAGLAQELGHRRQLLGQLVQMRLQRERAALALNRQQLQALHPTALLQAWRHQLRQRLELLEALSPERLLQRGFALVRATDGRLVRSVQGMQPGDLLQLELADGRIDAVVQASQPR